MKKVLFGLLMFFVLGIGNASAQSSGKYVRKPPKQPDFFMPQNELNKKEALPDFDGKKPREELNSISNKKVPAPEVASAASQENEYWKENHKDLSNSPQYKQKYNDYLSDLKIIGTTGEMPPNADLDADLAAMDSENRLLVNPKVLGLED